MKLKEFLVPLSFALLTTMAVQYFVFNKQTTESENPKSGERFTAPRSTEVETHKPLNLEVDFLDAKSAKKPVITKINTDTVRYVFTSAGAGLEHVEFKRNWGGKVGYLSTVFAPAASDRERSFLLVALPEQTPYFYDFLGKQEEQDRFIVRYQSDTEQALIEKTYTVFKDNHKIELELTIHPKAGPLRPRILFQSPLVPELGQKDVITALANNVKDKVVVTPVDEPMLTEYWSHPTLFGSQDRYFIHAMVADSNYFTQRGYYKLNDLNLLTAFLEGPEITEKKTWNLSFYVGPKEDDAILAVDPRLEETLNYGYLAFISRPVSKILLEILNFFYNYVKNYGLAIILVTLLLKLIMLPFTVKAERGQKSAQEFQKKLKHLEQSYKNNPEGLAKARAELIKKHGLPGLGSCVPLLFQLPLFIAFNWVISNSIELYMAPFLWIHDLAAPDPYYILPVLVALSVVASSMTMQGAQAQQKISSLGFGFLLGAFSATFSAGLSLFIFTNAAAHALQSYLTKRK